MSKSGIMNLNKYREGRQSFEDSGTVMKFSDCLDGCFHPKCIRKNLLTLLPFHYSYSLIR